jgi:LuxR family transcriptional regulator, maltose regulon positive regulatory protein
MTSPILNTKLVIPPFPARLVQRARLIERMNEGMQRKLTLLSAPAGYGKTTLLVEWIASCDIQVHPVLWLSLDNCDNDPHRFWSCFLEAIKELLGEICEGIRPDNGVKDGFSEEAMSSLINAVAAGAINKFSLILDDYQHINHPSIHSALDFLITNLPEKMHLVIASRQDPPISLAQLRARDQVVELRVDQLRFNRAEKVEFFQISAGILLTDEELAILDQRTEGWPAALQLAALSLKDREDHLTFIKSFGSSHRYIVDYLGEQVLLQQEETMKCFLMETSVLTRLNSGLCEAVSIGCDGQGTLEYLERHNLFLMPLDDERCWYRYHPLFGGYLHEQLRQLHPEIIPELHFRASRWYEDNEMQEEAILHALEGKHYERASQLIENMLIIMRSQGQWRTLLGWIKCMPVDLVYSRLPLCLAYASALIVNGQLKMAEPFLDAAEKPFIDGKPGSSRLFALAQNLRGLLAGMQGKNQEAIHFSQEAYNLFSEEEWRARGLSLLISGCCYFMATEFETAEQRLKQARSYLQESGHNAAYIRAVHYLGKLKGLQGRLREAREIYQHAIQLISENEEDLLAGIEQIDLGDLHREWNNLEEAARLNSAGLYQVEASGDYVFLRDGYIARARLEMALGMVDEALYYLHKADHLANLNDIQIDRFHTRAIRARIWAVTGRLFDAECWLENCSPQSEPPVDLIDEYILITRCWVLLAMGRGEDALCLALRLLKYAEAGGRLGRAVEIRVLLTLGYKLNGDLKRAQTVLKEALLAAEPEGFVRVFLDAGSEIEPLLAQIGKSKFDSCAGYAIRLLHALNRQKYPQNSILQSPSSGLLSKRELQILEMIAAGMSYQEISNELVIAMSTVQTHIRNMYVKLDVHSGIEAVNCARKLGLITQTI